MTTQTAFGILESFKGFVNRRTAVRLEAGNYQGAPDAYREDRNRIRRDTARFKRAYSKGYAYGAEAFAAAISDACKGSRLTYKGVDHKTGLPDWEFTPCQYSPVEIRWHAADIAQRAVARLKHRNRFTAYEAVSIVEGRTERMSEERILDAWQWLVETGTIAHLQGSLQRHAQHLMDEGLIV